MANAPTAARSTFNELLKGVEPGVATIARRLRKLILELDADAVETVRLGDNAATYGLGPRKMIDGYAYVMPLRGYVNLGFYEGAQLADREGLLEGSGKSLRHVKVRTTAEAANPAVRALVTEALASRRKQR